ncbi:hypothetical protein JJB07_03860 [Tumebacillus sp. ITR2]|uniref:Very-long-chain (3R)-3-hydroxyacyl-CoA dehydratase n=2 Tax=Tumebacillus amylolyticus TaxID=2801339 RepID=A0ABS1J664_9BACL|nr:hypothetical protein [Tumebacillus amylolyticus]
MYVPQDKLRDAWLIFLSKQVVTCSGGLFVVEMRWIEYPVRLLSYANRTSITFEFYVYPALCVLFNLHYPEGKGFWRELLHYVLYTSAITGVEKILEKYTNLITYVKWEWYWTFLSILLTFYLIHRFYFWYRKSLTTSTEDAHVG